MDELRYQRRMQADRELDELSISYQRQVGELESDNYEFNSLRSSLSDVIGELASQGDPGMQSLFSEVMDASDNHQRGFNNYYDELTYRYHEQQHRLYRQLEE